MTLISSSCRATSRAPARQGAGEQGPRAHRLAPIEETAQAQPSELASLVETMIDHGVGTRQAQWLTQLASNPRVKLPEALGEVARAQKLETSSTVSPRQSVRAFSRAWAPGSPRPRRWSNPHSADRRGFARLQASGSPAHGPRARHRSGRSRPPRARGRGVVNGHIQQFIDEAYPTVKPLVIAHRGGASSIYPENTLELLHRPVKKRKGRRHRDRHLGHGRQCSHSLARQQPRAHGRGAARIWL